MNHPLRPALTRRLRLGLAAVLAVVIAACGGVDSGGTGNSTVYAAGPITGLGSIVVGAVRYDDSNATITGDAGGTVPREALRIGMVVSVEGRADDATATGSAASIQLRSEVLGPAAAIDPIAGTLTVLGQPVVVRSGLTAFDGAITGGLAGLAAGDAVEVYGLLDGTGRIVATRIDRAAAGAPYKLRATITSVNLTSKTFVAGGLTIGWGSLTLGATPAVTQRVRVTLARAPVDGVWPATALSLGDSVPADRDRAELDGRITAFTSTASFSVAGVPVDASNASFPNGRSGVVAGGRVEVVGALRGGTLVASRVEVESEQEQAGGFELHGSIAALDRVNRVLTVTSAETGRSMLVVYDGNTVFEGGPESALRVGMKLEAKGSLSADGTALKASYLHIEL